MKKLLCALVLLSAVSAQASGGQKACLDPNFEGLKSGQTYDNLKYLKSFKQLFSAESPAPAGFEAVVNGGDLCHATKATYLQHVPSNKMYVMFTTHDDYCDGGNTLGFIVDMAKYRDEKTTEGSIVAEIGDSEVYCTKQK